MKHLFILRGPSGSGKSNFARRLADGYSMSYICSADHFFIIGGEYLFDKSKLTDAHNKCKADVEECMKEEYDCIIIDNTNIQHWEYQHYIALAKQFGYSYSVVVVGQPWNADELFARNIHGVPKEVILRQIASFSHFV